MVVEIVNLFDEVLTCYLQTHEKIGMYRDNFVSSFLIMLKLAEGILDRVMLVKYLDLIPRFLPTRPSPGSCPLAMRNFEFDVVGFFLQKIYHSPPDVEKIDQTRWPAYTVSKKVKLIEEALFHLYCIVPGPTEK